MSTKLLTGLAPVLAAGAAAGAFAVMPTAAAGCTAPACPHVYKNGVIASEGKKLRGVSWGTLKLKNGTLGEVECHDIGAGYAENPVGGGAAVGHVQAGYAYECVDPTCIALGGKAITATSGKLPWVAEAIEPKPGVFRSKTGFKGPELNKPPKEPGYVDFSINCEGVTNPEFFGEQDPLALNNGLSVGALPGEGELQPHKVSPESPNLESELLGEGETEGRIKGMGYGAQELLEIKNP